MFAILVSNIPGELNNNLISSHLHSKQLWKSEKGE